MQGYKTFLELVGFWGRARVPFHEVPIIGTICYISITCFICRLLRIANQKLPKWLQDYTCDVISTFQLCACGLENFVIRRFYGFKLYIPYSFCIGIWYSWTYDGSTSNPCKSLIKYMNGTMSLKKVVLKIFLQLIFGVIVGYEYARSMWYFEMSHPHAARYVATSCRSDLTVPFVFGFLIEFFGTILDVLIGSTPLTNKAMSHFDVYIRSFLGVCLTLTGILYTGMFLNPANASVQTFGCDGVSTVEHIFIYTIGPMVATALAYKLHSHLAYVIKTEMVTNFIRNGLSFDKMALKMEESGRHNEFVSSKNEKVQYGKNGTMPTKAVTNKNNLKRSGKKSPNRLPSPQKNGVASYGAESSYSVGKENKTKGSAQYERKDYFATVLRRSRRIANKS
ncbi:unnamed protein product [Owenia fusiformis]|uniref:Uncharacterized protein n=1 Tax=Owenia fusiformis TaxID=6347 RepID=A0A8J1Y5C5_OWEFU|nr:unnamed protein product [Owenia fusiformis]